MSCSIGKELESAFPFIIGEVRCRERISLEPFDGDAFEIVYVRRGRIYVRGHETKQLTGTQLIFFAPGGRSRLICLQGTELVRIIFGRLLLDEIAAGFWRDDLPRPVDLVASDSDRVVQPLCVPLASDVALAVSSIASSLLTECRERRHGYRSMVRAKLVELLLLLQRELSPESSQNRTTPAGHSIEAVLRYIQEHYSESFALNELASRSNVSAGYLSRTFREATGVPLFEYINRIRIQRACVLLKRSDMSIIDVAFSVGYHNISFFNRYFRRMMRMSPRQYRKLVER